MGVVDTPTRAAKIRRMITLKTSITGLRQARDELRRETRRLRFGIARGLTVTAREAQRVVRAEELRVFNRPNSYTLNAFRIEPAVASKPGPLQSVVELRKDPQYSVHPLTPQVLGGSRATKRFERSLQAKGVMPPGWYAIPTQHALDGSLKMRRGLVQQVIAQAQAQLITGYSKQLKVHRETGRERRKRLNAMNRSGGQFVFVPRRRGKLAPGVYLAEGRDFKSGYGRTGRLVPMFRYVQRVNYTPRLDFFGIVKRVAAERLPSAIKNILLYAG